MPRFKAIGRLMRADRSVDGTRSAILKILIESGVFEFSENTPRIRIDF
jgi:hypothetical protein